ncbi:diguanylate cyclase domain-containing protein [Marinobacter sp. P4B1]|uniref:sensor domain-containing diguanylate cyclase n=1 Tax=Marinobacter sp. P4B1 TaxID=1119533 RepID=UPI00071CF1B9|nr:diguanylate cyclase [Marinobacter sp. P4B1]KRW82681.1 hypothetical protein AQ621_10610 [Marinobacter sp. P4B1]
MKQVRHSLASRFVLFLAGLLVLAMIALLLIERVVFQPVLMKAENQQAGQELARIENSLEQNHNALTAQTRDWAHWDDTYQFIQDANSDYATSNFSREMFEDLHDQAMIFISEDQQPTWIAGIDPGTNTYVTCTSATGDCSWAAPLIAEVQPFLGEVEATGLALNVAAPWPALAAIAPILQTDRTGPSRGWLIKLRLIDERLTDLLEEQTGLPVQIATGPAPADTERKVALQRGPELLHAGKPLLTHSRGPELVLSTEIPRDRVKRASRIFRYSLAWTAVLLAVVIGVVLALLYGLVLKPLGQFTRFVTGKQGENSLAQRENLADVPGSLLQRKDEFGTLARHAQGLISQQREQSKMLLDLSQHDPLTGLANRRLFDASLQQSLSDEPEMPTSVLMLDIDHFKLYNDRYGHPEGDRCLASVAECMEQTVKPHGFLVARTGGEEFSVLMPETGLEQARTCAEELRKAIAGLKLPHADSPVSDVVTVSVGVASSVNVDNVSGSTLMRSADLALYEAKDQGRNRVACFGEDAANIFG